ncbi:NAD(P)-dependent oxidoreductase [uncultured Roseibium sp.]|uniref:NAD-dependent epimerase/dehydratase family protein n=1 Tax=uncultured Roseibium sp. TaxID=1936171 RepID=UPI0032162F40
MHVLLTGGTGALGRFIAAGLLEAGHEVTFLGRTKPEDDRVGFLSWDLSAPDIDLPAADALVHCALAHVPGRYRGGEGDDPAGFLLANVDGTRKLFQAAKAAGVRHCVFLSSRAVYADNGQWEVLTEAAQLRPDTLYGQVKLAGEEALRALCTEHFCGTSLRATGIYGLPPGATTHKWSELFFNFANGATVLPRVGTEVHGEDLASSVLLVLEKVGERSEPYQVYNVSDLLLDRQDLLKLYVEATGCETPLPLRAAGPVGVMEPGKLKVLGWAPGGMGKLREFVEAVAAKVS